MSAVTHYGVDPVLVTPGPAADTAGPHGLQRIQAGYSPQYEHWFVYALDQLFPNPFVPMAAGVVIRASLKKRLELQKIADTREGRAHRLGSIKQEMRWRVPLPRHGNGGVLTTAGNLVFEGTTNKPSRPSRH
jgi:quinohemoprotein ethanol dehydrogenase